MKNSLQILYKDSDIVVAVKPCGILSQSDLTGDEAMPEILSEHLKMQIYPVHRLDRAVGGVMVFACHTKAASKLGRQINEDGFVKEYLTVVHGVPENETGEYCDFLRHDPMKNRTEVLQHPDKHAKPARLSYRLLAKTEREETLSLLLIRLHSGRTHQIRTQLSFHGMPISGDGKYGAHDRCGIGLWACRLSFFHPTSSKKMTFAYMPEMSAPWSFFSCEDMKIQNISHAACGGGEELL